MSTYRSDDAAGQVLLHGRHELKFFLGKLRHGEEGGLFAENF